MVQALDQRIARRGVTFAGSGGVLRLVLPAILLSACNGAPPPPAIISDADGFPGSLTPRYADDDRLYFHYNPREPYDPDAVIGRPPGGIYVQPLPEGEPSLVLECIASRARVEGETLEMIALVNDSRSLVQIPLGDPSPESVIAAPLFEPNIEDSLRWQGDLYILSSDAALRGRTRIIRVGETEADSEVVFQKSREIYDTEFFATSEHFYWREERDGKVMRWPVGSEAEEELEIVSDLAYQTPYEGEFFDLELRLLGVIGDELLVSVYVRNVVVTGQWSNGDDIEEYDFAGGSILAVPADPSKTRVVAGEIRDAVIVGDTLYGLDRQKDLYRIDAGSGEKTLLLGTPELVSGAAANSDFLYYADNGNSSTAIRYVRVARAGTF
jgi:hypothetical protein